MGYLMEYRYYSKVSLVCAITMLAQGKDLYAKKFGFKKLDFNNKDIQECCKILNKYSERLYIKK